MNDVARVHDQAGSAPPDEAALVAAARDGDSSALEILVRRHVDDVYATALRVTGDPDTAGDAAQDAFLNALKGLPRYRGDASFRTWLLRITVNVARSQHRRRRIRAEVSLSAVPEPDDPRNDPERKASSRIEAERAEAALARLPEKQRLTVSLRVHQGLAFREIAEVTGSTEGAARVNYYLGIRKLREWLS